MAKLNILIADDAAFIRDLVRKVVRDIYPSSDVFEAIDGRKAINVMHTKEIHLVLCDWEMPEATGLDVLNWMRKDERYINTPFIMITSRGEREHVIKAVQAGVSEYIGKPFSRESLTAKVTKIVWKFLKVKPNSGAAGVNPRALSAAGAFGLDKKGGDLGGASVLMGSKPAEAPSVKARAVTPAEAAASSSERSAPKRSASRARGFANIRFASGSTAKLVIKDINLQELIGVFRRDGDLPQLLEQAVLDITAQEAGEVARINAYVRMMQAQEPSPDAQTIQMVLRYVDEDPEKLATLSRFIEKVR